MSSLRHSERNLLEKILEMRAGYVSDFSDRTLKEFVLEQVGIDISTKTYEEKGTSKANRIRTFWEKESDEDTAYLIEALLDHSLREKTDHDRDLTAHDEHLFIEARKITTRLKDEADSNTSSPTEPTHLVSDVVSEAPATGDTSTVESMAGLSNEELLTIIREAENTNVPGSRYQKAKTEWEIRHQQATLAVMKSNGKSAFVNIASGANVKGLTMKGNKMIGDGDFLRADGTLQDAHLESNEHVTNPPIQDKEWFEKPVGKVILMVIGGVVVGAILFYLGMTG